MDFWSEASCDINFSRLNDTTICHTNLKVKLKALGLLTIEEEQRLTALGRNEGNIREANELYNILRTRRGSLHVMMEVLKDLRQTDAWDILNNAVLKYNEMQHFANIETQVDLLLSSTVKTCGRLSSFTEAFPTFNRTDAMEIFNDAELAREFGELNLQAPMYLNLDGEIPEPRKLYIPRSISNRFLLNPNIFRVECFDVFVLKGFDRHELVRLADPHITRCSSTQLRKVTSRHIYLDAEEHWDEMDSICNKPMHLVQKENGEYVLVRSTKITETILQHCSNSGRQNHAYVDEDAFIEQLMQTEEDFKGALVCDVPGMGKTWLMESLTYKLCQKLRHSQVLFIQLSSFSQNLPEGIEALDDCNALRFALQYACTSPLAENILFRNVRDSAMSIFFFLDGFDEIRDNHVQTTTKFLTQLNNNQNVRLIISSRPHMRRHLEETFALVSYDILPFVKENQVDAIVAHWQLALPEADRNRLEAFAVECISSIKRIQHDDTHDILGLPLKCFLLAAVYEDQMKKIFALNQPNSVHISKGAAIKSIAVLYERFVDSAIQKQSLNSTMPSVKCELLNFYTLKALQLLFPEIAPAYATFKNMPLKSPISTECLRAGILCLNNRSKFDFLHRTLAEYFAGRFFAELGMNTSGYNEAILESFGLYFLEYLLETTHKVDVDKETKRLILPQLSTSQLSISCSFSTPTVLWFQENIMCDGRGLNHSLYLEQCIKGVQLPTHTVLHFQELLTQNIYNMLLACIQEGFQFLMSLIGSLHRAFVDHNIMPEMATMSLLLCHTAMMRRPEMAQELLRYFWTSSNNLLSDVNQHLSNDTLSPIEVAISLNDVDTFTYFFHKLRIPWERLFISCLTGMQMLQESDFIARIQMLETISLSRNRRLFEHGKRWSFTMV